MKKFLKNLSLALCLALIFPLAAACSPGVSISYNGSTLATATVGVEYEQYVSTATGADDIKYEVKENSLPVGLLLSADGRISGKPRNKSATAVTVKITASAGDAKQEAEFIIPSIGEGTLVFSTATAQEAAYNKAYSLRFAVTGAALTVTYTMTGELPAGLSFNNGLITGTPAAMDDEKTFSVTAASNDCASVTSDFTIKVVAPKLVYTGKTLSAGTVNSFYSENIATATGTDGSITYVVKSDSTLPGGLALSPTGFLSGTPTAQINRHVFTVTASSAGYSPADANFTITIDPAEDVVDSGEITYNSKAITSVYANQSFSYASGVTGASASNRAPVSYALASGSTLPGDLVILPDGTLRSEAGLPAAGTFTFSVVASAQQCASVTATFTLTVLAPKLIFQALTIPEMATTGKPFSYSIANATTSDGSNPEITYSIILGKTPPPGLTLSSAGLVSGTPTKAIEKAYIPVQISAPGYTTITPDVYININSPAENTNRFEFEYVDLTGKIGAGYSGSAREKEMIMDNPVLAASETYYVTFTYCPLLFDFNINSDKAVSGASFYISLSSEIGDFVLNTGNFDIRVNGKSILTEIDVRSGENFTWAPMQRKLVATGVSLKEGANLIEVEILPNTLLQGVSTGGPGLDYIEFTNLGSAVLSWTPLKWNIII